MSDDLDTTEATPPAERPTPITDAETKSLFVPTKWSQQFHVANQLGVVHSIGEIEIFGTRDQFIDFIEKHPGSACFGHLFVRIIDLERQLAEALEELDDFKANARFRCNQLQEQRDRLAKALLQIHRESLDRISKETARSALCATKGGQS